uniref:DNA polymerase III subunit delta, partial n=1 Tax=Buchnera aphidicola (Cinara pseudotsugae) TaxID=2518978 RepID=A0A451DFJ6_9GAMM
MLTNTMNLKRAINKKKIQTYIILESKYIFIKETQEIIYKYISKKKVYKKTNIIIKNYTDWEYVCNQIKQQDLFSTKHIFNITIYDSNISKFLKINMNKIENLSNVKVIKIFYFPKLKYNFLCNNFFHNYMESSIVLINNSLSYTNNINYWINKKIKKNNVKISLSAKNFLLKKFYINMNFYANLLENIILLYPNIKITYKKIYKYYRTTKKIEYYDWIKSIINFKQNQAIKQLYTLKKQKYDTTILINSFKTLIYIILYHKNKIFVKKNYINLTLYKKKIMKLSIYSIIKKTTLEKILLALKLLKKIELCSQNNYKKIVWMNLKTLSIILI